MRDINSTAFEAAVGVVQSLCAASPTAVSVVGVQSHISLPYTPTKAATF